MPIAWHRRHAAGWGLGAWRYRAGNASLSPVPIGRFTDHVCVSKEAGGGFHHVINSPATE